MSGIDGKTAATGETAESVFKHLDASEKHEAHKLAAWAVGVTVAKERDYGDTTKGWIDFAVTAALEAMLAMGEDNSAEGRETGDEEGSYRSQEAAEMAFIVCMPPMTSRRRAQAYIACVAVGLNYGFIRQAKARTMLYVAQLALTAHAGSGRKQHGGAR
jgi:hypothetical protein